VREDGLVTCQSTKCTLNYTHLSPLERYQIQCLLQAGLSIAQTALRLGRHRSTVARELQRNANSPSAYQADQAQHLAQARQSAQRNAQRLFEPHWALVLSYLQLDLSPQQAAHRLRLEQRLRISTSGIYKHLHRQAAHAGGATQPRLRCGRRRRKAHAGAGQLPDRVGIAQRPAIVDTRSRLGDWEGDTIVSGAAALAGLVTLTERRSRYTLAQHVLRRQAEPVGEAIIQMLRPYPGQRHTLTLDNGKEFAQHAWVRRRLDMEIYFADPHSPWQRGCNENHNGLLRHYFPKGCDLGAFRQLHVLDAVYRLNHRPRRCLGWKTPHEVFHGYAVSPLTLTG
jgi:IS30 family transposase